MITIFLLFAALRPSLSAPAVPIEGTHIQLFGRQLLPVPPLYRRAPQDIVWSCLVTVFACTWVAVHPNIPGPRESGWARFRRHALTMFYAIIAPELMTLWAMRQRYAAARIKQEYNEVYHGNVKDARRSGFSRIVNGCRDWFHGPDDEEQQHRPWTLAHGFFIQMGGLMYHQNGKPAIVLTFSKMKELIEKDIIDLPSIPEEDIFDKSKGDFLTKLLVVFQTSWFIVQCIGRWATALPLTELEVVTLAFAMLNIITYALWWEKPQNVQAAITIVKKQDAQDIVIETRRHRKGWLQRKLEENPGGVDGFLGWMMLVSLLAPLKLLRGLLSPLGKMTVDNEVPEGSTRMPMFYADHDITKEYHIVVPALSISVLFGALHLVSWVSDFPTATERMLWRISAVVITAEPLPVAIGTGLAQATKGRRGGEVVRMVIDSFAMSLGSIAFIGLPIYVLSRLTLLVLAFVTLRKLPPHALDDISWSSFVPHI